MGVESWAGDDGDSLRVPARRRRVPPPPVAGHPPDGAVGIIRRDSVNKTLPALCRTAVRGIRSGGDKSGLRPSIPTLGADGSHTLDGMTPTLVIVPVIPKDAPGRPRRYGKVMKPSPAVRGAAHRFAPR